MMAEVSGVLENIRRILQATGLYALSPGGLSASELAAYGAGFAVFEAAYHRLQEDLFIQTASSELLDAYESLFRPVVSAEREETRRAMLLQRFSVSGQDNTRAKLEARLWAAGVQGTITEWHGGGLLIKARKLLGLSKAAVQQELNGLLPAHLPYELEYTPFSWADIIQLTWHEIEAKGLSWAGIEAL